MSDIPRFLHVQMAVADEGGEKVVLRPHGSEARSSGIESLVLDAAAWRSLEARGPLAVTVAAPGESPRLPPGDPTVTSLRNTLLTLVTAVGTLPDLPETAKAALGVAREVLHTT
jgi:hypothetical protein